MLLKELVYHISWGTALDDVVFSLIRAVLLVFGGAFLIGVRTSEMSSSGVELTAGLSRLSVRWKDLLGQTYPYLFGFMIEWKDPNQPGGTNGIAVTKAMARAILRHPSCPPFHLSKEIRDSLGMPAGRRQA